MTIKRKRERSVQKTQLNQIKSKKYDKEKRVEKTIDKRKEKFMIQDLEVRQIGDRSRKLTFHGICIKIPNEIEN